EPVVGGAAGDELGIGRQRGAVDRRGRAGECLHLCAVGEGREPHGLVGAGREHRGVVDGGGNLREGGAGGGGGGTPGGGGGRPEIRGGGGRPGYPRGCGGGRGHRLSLSRWARGRPP